MTDPLFGALAVKNGFASESEVDLALEAQKEADPKPKIGEILLDMGALTPEKVNALVTEQACLRSGVVDAVPPPPGLAKRLFRAALEKLRRLWREVTGKRAREKAAAIERRDALLVAIAEACPASPELDKARAALETARASKDGIAAKNAVKGAEGRLHRALLKIGRAAADKGPLPAGKDAEAAEIRALDASIRDLS
jgi:hypothetical protein